MATLLERLHNRNYAFMTCRIKVNTRSPGWQRTVRSVLSKIHGVHSCKMDEYGVIEVSGIVSPELLIEKISKAGRKAQLLSIQFGQCSSNLYAAPMHPKRSTSAEYHTYGGDYGYGQGLNHGEYAYQPRHPFRPFAGLAHEIQQQSRRANLGPRHSAVYVPRYGYGGDTPGCCRMM